MTSTDVLPTIVDHPDITDEQYQAILADLPKCPECGSDIYEVHFIAHQTHRFEIQVDGSCGDVLATSELHDVVDIEPAGIWALDLGVDRFSVEVECENQHQWLEPRLRLTRLEGSTYATWEVLPAPIPMLCLICGSDQHTHPECPTEAKPATMDDVVAARAQVGQP